VRSLVFGLFTSYRDIEEIMKERGLEVDHSTIQRWVVHYAPKLERTFQSKKKHVGDRWRLDETYIKVKGQMKTNKGDNRSPEELFYALAS
jgi:transposase-like protein